MRREDKIQKMEDAKVFWIATIEFLPGFDYWLDMNDIIKLMQSYMPNHFSKHYLKRVFWKELYQTNLKFRELLEEKEY